MKNKILLCSCLLLFSINLFALDEIYNVSYKDSIESLKKKLSSDVTKKPDHITVQFKTPLGFNPGAKDVFELIESPITRDLPLPKIILGHPASGRIFTLNTELKVTTLDLMAPWRPSQKLNSFKTIMNGLKEIQIEKKKK